MHLPEENILQNLTGASTLADVSAEQLQQIINEFPYYGAAYVLLAKKLYATKENGHEKALQKAALHCSNSLWLQFNLEEEKSTETFNEINNTEINSAENEALKPDEVIDTGENNFIEDEILADAANEKLSNLLQQQAAEFEKPVEAGAEIIVESTPYHRVDYFDSQGIKLEEEKANDKLGMQLKRFTDWLKQMKRVNTNTIELENDEAGETQVQHIAEHSNESKEIITEAMAEVLIKQGKPKQAIQIYEKLSFNNPSKSAYFAAKIEELKG